MTLTLIPHRAPEDGDSDPGAAARERELRRKAARLRRLRARLAERELELARLEAELEAFERRYLEVVGARYARLDELRAVLAAELARRFPGDPSWQIGARHARERARASAAAFRRPELRSPPRNPSPELKRLFRRVARAIHPDLAPDEASRAERTRLMAEANRAYRAGDRRRLRRILRAALARSGRARAAPDPGARLARLTRAIARVKRRLAAVERRIARLRASELHALKLRVEAAAARGRDLLAELAVDVDREIATVWRQLERLDIAAA